MSALYGLLLFHLAERVRMRARRHEPPELLELGRRWERAAWLAMRDVYP